uniref:EOG090X0J9J n=1 Tax=Eubosmina coregoni TaxID=186181 RepID=A0A4Y7LPE0_9CRUS|nr:EOG090X0J9J [Eubosmina coregoni]SVE70186.1 EOG090X0J9J [Eubosmina coregoni]
MASTESSHNESDGAGTKKSPSTPCSPKKGNATLSTSTSSYEPLETHDPHLNKLAVTMFEKVSNYLQAELTSSESEYQLLEQMNKATTAKYQDMRLIAANVGKGIVELNEKFKSLQGYLDQIDQIEENISKLESAAYKLDAYTVRLENKFKSLSTEKR